jgi:hypothetical protein
MPDPRQPSGSYVYAVLHEDAVPDQAPTGLDDVPLEFVRGHGLAAAVSTVALDRPPGRRAELVAHHRAVDALAAATTVVPVQFGSVMAGPDHVRDGLLAERADHFHHLLERLEGLHQWNLRGSYDEATVLAEVIRADPDVAELRRRTRDLPEGTTHPDLVRLGERVAQALEAKREAEAGVVLERVLPRTRGYHDRGGAGVDHLFDVALLVHDDDRAAFEEDLEELAEAVHERIRLRLVGPLAAYDFVEEAAWA